MLIEKKIDYPYDDMLDLYTGSKLEVIYRDDGTRPSYSCPGATSLLVPQPREKLLALLSTRDGIISKANSTEMFQCPYSGALIKVVEMPGGMSIAVGGVNLRDRVEDPFTLLYRIRMRKGVPAFGTFPAAPRISASVPQPEPKKESTSGDGVSDTSKDAAEQFLKDFDTKVTVSMSPAKAVKTTRKKGK